MIRKPRIYMVLGMTLSLYHIAYAISSIAAGYLLVRRWHEATAYSVYYCTSLPERTRRLVNVIRKIQCSRDSIVGQQYMIFDSLLEFRHR